MVRTKPGQKIHVDTLQTTWEKLEQLETKPKSELNLRESILFLKDKLNSALKKGYSYQDLSEILSEQKILISAATLKQYLTDLGKKKSSSRKKSRKSVSSSGTSSGNEFSGKPNTQISTNVTDSKEELETGNSDPEINRMKEQRNSERAVYLDSTTGTKSSTANSKKAKAQPSSQSSGNKSSSTKTNVLSGRSDDLSSEFNSF